MSKTMRANLLLTVTVLIWGTAFVAQKIGTTIGVFTFGGMRMTLGGLVLLPVCFLVRKLDKGLPKEEIKKRNKNNLIGGIICGIALFMATNTQQYGIFYTTVSKAGFITALYVVFVPIAGLIIGKKVTKKTWLCAVIALVGFYFLSLYGQSLNINKGDFFTFLCAISFTIQILCIDHFSPKCDGVILSSIEFLSCGIINLVCMFIFEEPVVSDILACWMPIVYTGVISCGIAYTFQTLAQKDAEPTQATLIMSMEAVVSAVAGAIILKERLTGVQYIACFIILIATIIANLPGKKEKK